MPDAQRGGTVEPGKGGENIVVTGQTQGAYFAQTPLGLFIGIAIVAGDFAVDPDVGVRFLGKEEAAAVSVLAEL